MDGKLFSQDFLLDGIKTTPVWEALSDDALNIFINDLKSIYAPLSADSQLNEANTEADIIEKVLDLLGWRDLSRVARECGDYPLLSGGDINLYSLFVERAQALIHPRGVVGLLCPSGIAADKGAAEFFRSISTTGRLAALYNFENKKTFFPDVHASFKFCALIFGGEQRTVAAARCAFYLHTLEEADDPARILSLTAQDFSAVNPNTGAAPIFRTKRDADITTAIYRRQPVLCLHQNRNPSQPPLVRGRAASLPPDKGGMRGVKAWPVRYYTMFHMTNDSHLFKRRDELEAQGWYPVGGNRWKKGEAEAVPLYEGKMVQMFDHCAANVVMNADNLHRPAQQEASTSAQHADPAFSPMPQFYMSASDVQPQYQGQWVLAFKEITAPTNIRSMIACIAPGVGFGNKLPLWLPEKGAEQSYAQLAPLLAANFNSFAFDFVVRQKLQGQTLNLFIVEQLPLIRPEQFEQTLPSPSAALLPLPQAGEGQGRGCLTIADFVRGEVLRLSYTAHDLALFARDLGYDGAPLKWDEDDRRHRLARLDALFFQLYGLSRDDAAYILDTFPIVREQDEKAHGCYLTKELILAYINAVAAGDFTTVVQVWSVTAHDLLRVRISLNKFIMRIIASIKLCLTFALLLCASLAHAGNMLFTDHPLVGKIWDMNSRSYLDEAALLASTSTVDVLLLGETHDNPQHHEHQQKLLKARIESGVRPALMMEQLDAESQPALDQALTGSNRDEVLNSVTGLIRFTDWEPYRPLLAIAIDNKLPVIAANISSQRLQPVIWHGYAVYDADELKRLAVEEVWSDSRQNYLATHMGGAHCGELRDELRVGLTRSQRLRDALMADSAVSSIGRGVVAIVGRDHARRDTGLPLYFAARAPSARILSIGFVEVSPERTDPKAYEAESATGDAPYDVIWFTPRVERADLCANFGNPKGAQPKTRKQKSKPSRNRGQ